MSKKSHSFLHRFLALGVTTALGLTLNTATANNVDPNFPSKPINLLVGFAAGGSVDNAARVVANKLSAAGWKIVVVNRPGASGMIAARELSKSAPDGYTLMMGSVSTLAMVPAASSRPMLDPVADLTPVAKIGGAPLMLLANNASPISSISSLVQQAKSSADPLPLASGGMATPPQLAGALFAELASIKINHVSYKGEAPAIVDVMGNHVPVMFANLTTAMPHVSAGKMKAIAVTGKKRAAVAPAVPTFVESGYPDLVVENWFGIVAPGRTPDAIVARIHDEVSKALSQADVKAQFAEQGLVVDDVSSKEFGAFMQSEAARWSKVVRNLDIKLD